VVDSVRVHVNNADTTSGWVYSQHSSTSYNLLNLVNGVNAMIGTPAARWTLHTAPALHGSGSNVVVNGQTNRFNVPSGSQSGSSSMSMLQFIRMLLRPAIGL